MPWRRSADNVLLIGPLEVGTSRQARRLTTILSAMPLAEAIETTRIHRVAGLTGDRTAPVPLQSLQSCRGFRLTRGCVWNTDTPSETCRLGTWGDAYPAMSQTPASPCLRAPPCTARAATLTLPMGPNSASSVVPP